MKVVPLTAVPGQTLSIVLGNQPVQIALATRNAELYFTLSVGNVFVTKNRICRNAQRLLLDSQYHGFAGDFAFIDTQGDTEPVYEGLGSRYFLIYFESADLA